MNIDELGRFLLREHFVFGIVDEENARVKFRDESLPWYQNDKERCTAITFEKLIHMDDDEVMKAIRRGLEVEGITRITGYYSKTNQWNKGKKAELKDRRKHTVGEG